MHRGRPYSPPVLRPRGAYLLLPPAGSLHPGQRERARARPAIQEEQGGVAADAPPALAARVGCPAVDQHAEDVALRISPVVGGHLAALGAEPRDVPPAGGHLAAEVPTAAQYRVRRPDREHRAGAFEQRAAFVVELPVD